MGGAKTILEKYLLEADFSEYTDVYVLAPPNTTVPLNKGVSHIKMSTSGIWTFLFSVLGIIYWKLRLNADTILSFSNVNLILPMGKRITYFHQYLALKQGKERPWQLQLIYLTQKYLSWDSTVVVQTEYIKQVYSEVIGNHNEIIVRWPGYYPFPKNNDEIVLLGDTSDKKLVFTPITNIEQKHRNFEFIRNNKSFFVKNNLKLILPCEEHELIDKDYMIAAGYLGKNELSSLLRKTEFMINVSLEETVGLMLYEYTSLGKPVLILDRPYLESSKLLEIRSDLVYPFKHEKELQNTYLSMTQNAVKCVPQDNLQEGEWP
ncbi:hypothetical protein BCT68_07875 [Vibrio breoganii]|nr:hypothetical protein BCT68_07875 [Vibrio breoganii]